MVFTMDIDILTLTIHFIVLSLAGLTWASLLVEEHGMFGIFQMIRDWAGVRHISTASDDELAELVQMFNLYPEDPELDENGSPISDEPEYDLPDWFGMTNLSQMLTCIACTSLNVNFSLTILYLALMLIGAEQYLVIAMLPFAARAIQMRLHQVQLRIEE